MSKAPLYLNLVSQSTPERVLAARLALTIAKYLAYNCGLHVAVILRDTNSYANASREVSAAREKCQVAAVIPVTYVLTWSPFRSVPVVLKSRQVRSLSFLFRSCLVTKIAHLVPDFTGYSTERQIFLDRKSPNRQVSSSISVLSSLSRLMKCVSGKGTTNRDHGDVSRECYAAQAIGMLLLPLGPSSVRKRFLQKICFTSNFKTSLRESLVLRACTRPGACSLLLTWLGRFLALFCNSSVVQEGFSISSISAAGQ